jgi:hypothetical protein
MLRFSLYIFALLDAGIPAFCWGDRIGCPFNEEADIPAETTYIQQVSYDRLGHQCGSGRHYCLFALLPFIQRAPQFNYEKVSGMLI